MAGLGLTGAGLAGAGLAGCGLLFEDPATPAPAGPAEEGTSAGARPSATGEPGVPALPGAQAGGLLAAEELPAGQGTLRQDEIAIRLRRGEVELFVVPLDEAVTRTAAPDTWGRLSALATTHRSWFRERTGSDAPYPLFLVALYSEAEPATFEGGEITLVSGGIRQRPLGIRGLTPGWDQQRLQPGEAQMAVFAFPPQVTLEADLEVEYREVRSREWLQILSRVSAEQRRIRGR